jgi:hypothetical protein
MARAASRPQVALHAYERAVEQLLAQRKCSGATADSVLVRLFRYCIGLSLTVGAYNRAVLSSG